MSVIIHIDSPGVTIEEFHRRTGMAVRTIQDKIDNGELPLLRTSLTPGAKELRMINMLKYMQLADVAEFNHPRMNGG